MELAADMQFNYIKLREIWPDLALNIQNRQTLDPRLFLDKQSCSNAVHSV